MSKQKTVHLGYEVGSGEPVSIPLGHMVVFGQTQQAGKTTALEAIIARSGCRAVAFVTKRGEGGFAGGRQIPPYLVERADWQSVQAILESALQAKQDYKQAWIMRACEGAHSLADVQANTRRLLDKSKKGLDQDMYYVLDHYFDIVIPQIRRLPKSDTVELGDGLNVMAMDGYSPELQALVIRSVIEWVHEREKGVLTVVPEAWRFLPQGRRSPVRQAAEELVREGAGLHNFVLIDSQDIGGVDKLPLRAAKVWLIGVQREANELKRNLDNIPAGFAKPKPADVATLELGQFYACFGTRAIKTYVQPAWMTEQDARRIATGQVNIESVSRPPRPRATGPTDPPAQKEDDMEKKDITRLEQMIGNLAQSVGALAKNAQPPMQAFPPPPVDVAPGECSSITFDALYENFKQRLMADAPAILKLVTAAPELVVEVQRQTVNADGKTLFGRIAGLLAGKFFDEGKTTNQVRGELKRTGPDANTANIGRELKKLQAMGFVTLEGSAYRAVAGMKARVVETGR